MQCIHERRIYSWLFPPPSPLDGRRKGSVSRTSTGRRNIIRQLSQEWWKPVRAYKSSLRWKRSIRCRRGISIYWWSVAIDLTTTRWRHRGSCVVVHLIMTSIASRAITHTWKTALITAINDRQHLGGLRNFQSICQVSQQSSSSIIWDDASFTESQRRRLHHAVGVGLHGFGRHDER
jgi:hypothetical protein